MAEVQHIHPKNSKMLFAANPNIANNPQVISRIPNAEASDVRFQAPVAAGV